MKIMVSWLGKILEHKLFDQFLIRLLVNCHKLVSIAETLNIPKSRGFSHADDPVIIQNSNNWSWEPFDVRKIFPEVFLGVVVLKRDLKRDGVVFAVGSNCCAQFVSVLFIGLRVFV